MEASRESGPANIANSSYNWSNQWRGAARDELAEASAVAQQGAAMAASFERPWQPL